jgi:hypothetical protein
MKRLIPFVVALLAFSACETPEMPLPGITGKAGELVVVMDEKYWKSEAGDTVFNSLTQHVYGLPQPEPMFNVVHIKSSAFTKIFQTHRNIIHAVIGQDQRPSIELKTDVWATPQVVVEIRANSVEEFVTLFGANASKITAYFISKEEARVLKSYNAQLNTSAVNHVRDKFGLQITIPKGYNVVSDKDDFSWVRYDTKDLAQNVLIYREPYAKDNTFSDDGMKEVVSKFCKANVPGPDNGTYMGLYEEYPPIFSETSIGSLYASKLTGLWRVERALMGGPFVCYAMLDQEEKHVIYIYGFVFAPGKKKRNYVRQVDAILNSTKPV